jgi:hypothetical protein
MSTAAIIAALLPIFAQAAPQLIADIVALIKGNPQAQGETDAAYIARIDAEIAATTQHVVDEDKQVQG